MIQKARIIFLPKIFPKILFMRMCQMEWVNVHYNFEIYFDTQKKRTKFLILIMVSKVSKENTQTNQKKKKMK